MSQPLVSVVVPVYNAEKYLDRCVTSIVNQTYENLEIILVDDGSPDNCPAMCDEWATKNDKIKVIHQQNSGPATARNQGMECANGKFISFVDSDDYIDPTTIKKCVDSAICNNSQVVIFGVCDTYQDGTVKKKPLAPTKTVFKDNSIKEELLPSFFSYGMGFGVSCCMKMFDLEFIKNNQLKFVNNRNLISEDAYFVLQVFAKITTASIVSENLYYYYKNQQSRTRAYSDKRQAQNNDFLLKCTDIINKYNLPEIVLEHIKVRYHYHTIEALKQLECSSLTSKTKKEKINQILKSIILQHTIKYSVLEHEQLSLKLFFVLAKCRCYGLCYLLLKLKTRKDTQND